MKMLLSMLLVLMTAGCSSESGLSSSPQTTDSPTVQTDNFPYTIETVADELNVPWEMDFAPDGRIFLTERPGTVRVIEQGKLLPEPVYEVTDGFISKGEGGLLGLVLDPDFANNHYIYVYHTYESQGEVKNRVLRVVENKNKAVLDKILISDLPGATNHNGGRIKIGPDGHLYITSGDRYEPDLAQNKNSLGGKILRIELNGSIPADNPFSGSPIYSLGHRNAQGLAWHPETGKLYSSEHGQSAHDEINLIEPGGNYGWPLIEGDESLAGKPELIKPLIHSNKKTWAPSGMTFITQGPWKGQLLVANLRGNQVLKIKLGTSDDKQIANVEPILTEWGRIRNIYEAEDGSIYVMTNNRDGRGDPQSKDDKLIRLKLKD